MNFEVHFVGYIYEFITDLINVRKMERIKTVYMWWTDVYSTFNRH
jgi:hypothetical protein